MTNFLILFALLSSFLKTPHASIPSLENFIFEGSEAEIGQFPYMAHIHYFDNAEVYGCSGCLVTKKDVLTAAHCFPRINVDPENVEVLVGFVDLSLVEGIDLHKKKKRSLLGDENSGFQKRIGKTVTINENYNPNLSTHDVAIVTVNKPFKLTSAVRFVGILADKISEPTDCTILGWGKTETNPANKKLMYAASVLAAPVSYGCPVTLTGDFYCLIKGGSGTCTGDSGSPLICDGMVRGVASYVVDKNESKRVCGETIEEIYVDLSEEKEFLRPLVPLQSNIACKAGITMLFTCFINVWLN